METFSIEKYVPIDYGLWILGNEARNGVNIKKLEILNKKELELWNYAVHYQDCRNDPGHAEISTLLGIRLLEFLPGIREVVVPSIIFHDTGWYGNDPDAWKKLAEANKDNLKALDSEELRRPHQNTGIMVMGRGFQQVGYPDEKYHFECAYTVGDHDTRKLPTTESGRIMRIADLLWRVTYPHAEIYMRDWSPEDILKRVEKTCLIGEKVHLGEVGVALGKLELANTMYFKFGEEEARRVLLPEYEKELERVAENFAK